MPKKSAVDGSRKEFAKKSKAPVIVITASSDDSVNLDSELNVQQPDEEEEDFVRVAPPEAEVQLETKDESQRNWILALVLQMIYIGLVIASSQLTTSAFHDPETKKYKAPFLFIWCKVFLRWMAFPSVLFIQLCIRLVKRESLAVGEMWQHCTSALRDQSGTVRFRLILIKFLPMSVTLLLMQVGWIFGLVYAPASIVTALCAATVALSYVLSWLILKHKVLLIKGLFVIVAFIGIGLISLSTQFGSEQGSSMDSLNLTTFNNATEETEEIPADDRMFADSRVAIGVFCGIGAAVSYSLHQLTFKLAYPKADFLQVSLIMSVMSIFICVLFFPFPIIMNQIGREEWHFSKLPWAYMLMAWFASYISSISYAYGLALSNPFFMSVAEVMIVALSTLIDSFARKILLTDLQIAGTALIAMAFTFMVMPDNWLSVRLKKRRPVRAEIANGKPHEMDQLNPE